VRRILLTLLLVALCAVHQSTLKAQDLVGRWELTAVTDRRGQVLPPAKDGAIPYVATLPLANFGPGKYELHTTVKHGATVVEETASFVINP